jgi:hypothetical protein
MDAEHGKPSKAVTRWAKRPRALVLNAGALLEFERGDAQLRALVPRTKRERRD